MKIIWICCGVAAWLMVLMRTVFRAKKTVRAFGSAIVLVACLFAGPIALITMIADWKADKKTSKELR